MNNKLKEYISNYRTVNPPTFTVFNSQAKHKNLLKFLEFNFLGSVLPHVTVFRAQIFRGVTLQCFKMLASVCRTISHSEPPSSLIQF